MAIQFPPITLDDPAPENGDLFLDIQSGNVWEYDSVFNSWTMEGLVEYGAFQYRGNTLIQQKAPLNTQVGFTYTVADGGVADASYIGLAGTDIPINSLITVGPGNVWAVLQVAAASPFIRVGNTIVPQTAGDDLDMQSGSYVISSLSELP